MKNKKKILAIVLMGLLVLTLVPAAVFAGYGSQQGQGIGYVDANGDGICDNNDGLTNSQDGAGLQRGHRGRFVDNDSDGICDNNDGLGCSQNGTGSQRGHRGGHRK